MSAEEKARQLEHLFLSYHPLLVRMAFRYLRDIDEAEEAVQEVFVNVWNRRATLTLDDSLKSYLIRSVRNRSLNLLERRKESQSIPEHLSAPAGDWLQEANAEQRAQLTRIYQAIDQLPPKCREIFLLSREEGLEYQEIADFLGVSVKTVETQIGIALRKLRKAVQKKS